MTSKNVVMGVAKRGLKLTIGGALALCFVQCSAEQGSDQADSEQVGALASELITNPPCGSVACANVNDCTSGANWPLCAKPLSAVCHSVSHECTYHLKSDTACPCLERDVRHCNINATTGGVQICVANAGRTATYWDTCQATPVCVP
jgi:hypothetical protein